MEQFQRSWVKAIPREVGVRLEDNEEEVLDESGKKRRGPKPKRKTNQEKYPALGEMVFYSGGPVFTLKSCPVVERNSAENAVSFHVAIAPHSKNHKLNTHNRRLEGDALIQVVKLVCKINPPKIQDTQLCYAIRHRGAVTWDVAWCPSKQLPGLGLVAAALGNGEVCVYHCQSKKIVDKSDQPAVLDLKPVMKSHDLQKRNSMPACLAWYPEKPYDKLLVSQASCFQRNVS